MLDKNTSKSLEIECFWSKLGWFRVFFLRFMPKSCIFWLNREISGHFCRLCIDKNYRYFLEMLHFLLKLDIFRSFFTKIMDKSMIFRKNELISLDFWLIPEIFVDLYTLKMREIWQISLDFLRFGPEIPRFGAFFCRFGPFFGENERFRSIFVDLPSTILSPNWLFWTKICSKSSIFREKYLFFLHFELKLAIFCRFGAVFWATIAAKITSFAQFLAKMSDKSDIFRQNWAYFSEIWTFLGPKSQI